MPEAERPSPPNFQHSLDALATSFVSPEFQQSKDYQGVVGAFAKSADMLLKSENYKGKGGAFTLVLSHHLEQAFYRYRGSDADYQNRLLTDVAATMITTHSPHLERMSDEDKRYLLVQAIAEDIKSQMITLDKSTVRNIYGNQQPDNQQTIKRLMEFYEKVTAKNEQAMETAPKEELGKIEFVEVSEPRLWVYETPDARIQTSWEEPPRDQAYNAKYALGLDRQIADDYRGSDFKPLREALGDGDHLVVLKGGQLRGEVRWADKQIMSGDSVEVDEPKVWIFATDEKGNDIQTAWQEPSSDLPTTAKYARGLNDYIADSFGGSDMKTLREALGDGDRLVVVKGGHGLHGDLRWEETKITQEIPTTTSTPPTTP